MKAIYENHYLTDRDVANFARQSFAALAHNFSETENNGLVRFLARGMRSGDWDSLVNKMFHLRDDTLHAQTAKDLAVYMRKIATHWVPFGHPQITLRISAPVPIRVQCFKHKIGFVESEESRRYISTRPIFYIPPYFRTTAADVKQGSGDIHTDSGKWLREYTRSCEMAIDLYERMIGDGVCPEQARFILPQGCEVNWVWTGSLYAFANFYNQRSDSHAQKEVQVLAEQVNQIITPLFPVSWPALTAGKY